MTELERYKSELEWHKSAMKTIKDELEKDVKNNTKDVYSWFNGKDYYRGKVAEAMKIKNFITRIEEMIN